jgi:hypothetical protein
MRQTEAARAFRNVVSKLRRTALALKKLGKELESLYVILKRNPPTVTGFIHTLPAEDLVLVSPLGVLLSYTGRQYQASLAEAELVAEGRTREQALQALRQLLVATYARLRAAPESEPALWATLQQLIRPKRPLPWLRRPGAPDLG